MMPAQCDSDTLTVLCSSKCLQQSRDNRKLFVDCRECGKKFHAYPSNNSQYCSRECSDTGHQDRSIERFASGKSKPSKRKTYPYGKVLLDSSWELALVEKLDALNVYWVREYPLKYTDRNGKIRTFFLDFYLPEHNKGIEVKAPYTLELNGSKESDKIAYIKQYYPNITWLWSLKDCQTFKMEDL
ncbi:MAG: hypothetical protein K0U41_02080 [Gammaproteobacteria bacterium]|nr:hypothetical protein [Gammaproteobacteria bacterium]